MAHHYPGGYVKTKNIKILSEVDLPIPFDPMIMHARHTRRHPKDEVESNSWWEKEPGGRRRYFDEWIVRSFLEKHTATFQVNINHTS